MQTSHTITTGDDQSRHIAFAAPARSLDQRRQALLRANEVRSTRAAIKRAVREHCDPMLIVDQLEAPSEHFETMKVFDLLKCLPKVGRVKADKMLRTARISPSKTVGGLSDRQRNELTTMLPQAILAKARA